MSFDFQDDPLLPVPASSQAGGLLAVGGGVYVGFMDFLIMVTAPI